MEFRRVLFRSITTKNDEFCTEMLEYYQLILLKNKKLAFTVIKHLGIIGCLAIKNTRFTIALNAGNFILSIIEQFNDESEIKILALKIMQNLLSMSMRMRNSELFILLLTSTSKTYLSLKTFEEYKEALKFLNAIYFKVADRRIKEAFSLLNSMGIILAQKEFQEIKCLKVFVLELTQLIAQMAKRKWDKEAEQLLENLFIFLYKNKKFKLIYFAILNLSLHFKIYADWDGFKNALRVYAIWQRIMALLLELAINKRYLPAEIGRAHV